ncbi:MAG: DUF4350 domain-containing protein [Nitriliruptor sp.]|nr:MAG: DUF4350 domain-containing protein [Nitriliruptor sp.]
MSELTTADPRTRTRRSRTAQLLLGAVGLLALVLSVFLLGPPVDGLPLDPDSVAPDGLRGVVEVLEQLEVEVTVEGTPPDDRDTRALLPVDRLDATTRAAWEDWIEDGGELVVADPGSLLHDLAPVGSDQLFGRSARSPDCDLLPEVGEVLHSAWEGIEVPDGATACFPIGEDGAWLVRVARGEGAVVVLGSAAPLTNGLLDEADNAVLAAALLGPAPGERLVVIPRPDEVPATEGGLLALVPDGVWQLLALLVLALLLAVVRQGRRDGVVVTESLPPVLPSAELARSLAGLLQRAGDRADAAERLRRGNRRTVARTLGLAPDAAPATLLHEVLRRSAVAEEDAEVALLPGGVDDDAGLVAVAAAGRRLRADLTRAPSDPTDPS